MFIDTWTLRTSGTSQNLLGVAYGAGTFVAVGLEGIILQSDPEPKPIPKSKHGYNF